MADVVVTNDVDTFLKSADNAAARTNLEVYSDAEVDAKLATKATAGGVQIESASSTSADMGSTTDFVDIGGVYTVSCYAKIDIANNQYNLALAGTVGDGLNNRAGIQVLSGGIIQFGERVGGVASTTCKRGNYTVGQWHHIVGIANNGTYTLYIDGDEKTSTGTYQLLGAREGFIWGNATIASDVNKRFSLKDCRIFNRALTATEIQELYDTNTVAVADRWGLTLSESWTDKNTVNSFSSTGIDNFSFTTVSERPEFYTESFNVKKGDLIKATLTVDDFSGAAGLWYFGLGSSSSSLTATNVGKFIYTSGGDSFTLNGISNGGLSLNDGINQTYDVIIEAQSDATNISFRSDGGSSTSFSVSVTNISVEKLGCIADLPLDEGIGYQFHDRSSNHFDALASTSGVTHLVPKTEGYIRDFNVDAYNGGSGNAQLIDSTRVIVPIETAYSGVSIINRKPSDITLSGLTLEYTTTNGGAQVTGATFGTVILGEGATVSAPMSTTVGRAPTRTNLQLDGSSDPDATNLDVRVDYKVIS